MHEYSAPEIIAIITALGTLITNVIVTFQANRNSRANGERLQTQGIQLDNQDNDLRTIKNQTNGGYSALQKELMRVSAELEQLKVDRKK